MRSIVFNPDQFQGTPVQRVEQIHALVRYTYCNDTANRDLGLFTAKAFAAVMYRGFIPDIVYGHPYRAVRRRLLATFALNGGKISVRRLMGGAIRIRIISPLRDLEKEALEGRSPKRRRSRNGRGNEEAPRKADDAGAA